MPLKTVNVLGVLQVFALTACYLISNWMAKVYEKTGHPEYFYDLPGWLKRMSLFKTVTLLLLLIPVVTAGFCMVRAKVSRGVQWLGPQPVTVLVIVTLGIWFLAVVLSLHAISGPPRGSYILRF